MNKLILITSIFFTAACSLGAEPTDDAKNIIRLLGIDAVFFDPHLGSYPVDMIKDMEEKGLSRERITSELAAALEKDFTPSEIREFAAFLAGPIWSKFRTSDRKVFNESNTEFSKELARINQKWNEYMSDKTLPNWRKEK